MRTSALIAGLLVMSVVGCKTDAAAKRAEDMDKGTGAHPVTSPAAAPSTSAPVAVLDPSTLGDVTGTIRFTGKAPAAVKIDTSMDPACGLGSGPDVMSELYAVKDGKLANVYLYIKSGPAEAMSAPHDVKASVVLDQKGCRYTPHVIAVAAGGFVEFRNEDPTMHNIHTMPASVGNETVDVSQGAKGVPQTKQFKAAETMIPVRCNNHPWMNAFINVSATPFFAVSDGAGHYEIHGLPAGEYVFGAVHEKMGEQTMQVSVKAGSNTHADFAFAVH
jgi:plastocyanin